MRSPKKWVTLLTALAVVGVGFGTVKKAEADSGFNLINSFGVYLSDAATALPAGNLVQLIWTADMAYHPTSPGGLDSAGYLGSGDYILFETTTPTMLAWAGDLDGGATYDSTDVGGAALPSGFVYARIFESSSAAAVTGGTWFLNTAFVTVVNESTNAPADTPDIVDVAPGGGVGPAGGAALDMQVPVPEPATLAGMGLGLLAILAWRRKIRS